MTRLMECFDGARVLEIYKMGIDSKNSTFEVDLPTWEEWDIKHFKHSRFVYTIDNLVVGWIALSPTSSRNVYRGVAEVSVYIDNMYQGRGVGSRLMAELIKSSEEQEIWTLVSSVFPENTATLSLHKKFGFRIVGTREKIACLGGTWRDTIILERRSKKINYYSTY